MILDRPFGEMRQLADLPVGFALERKLKGLQLPCCQLSGGIRREIVRFGRLGSMAQSVVALRCCRMWGGYT